MASWYFFSLHLSAVSYPGSSKTFCYAFSLGKKRSETEKVLTAEYLGIVSMKLFGQQLLNQFVFSFLTTCGCFNKILRWQVCGIIHFFTPLIIIRDIRCGNVRVSVENNLSRLHDWAPTNVVHCQEEFFTHFYLYFFVVLFFLLDVSQIHCFST